MLGDLIGKATRLPVSEVKHGLAVEPDHIYVIPPNAFMTIAGGVFSLTSRTKERGQHLAVSYFMRSLAGSRGNRAIGVILSGTGTDGTLGLESIKAEGGITFAQKPSTAKYDGMPLSAIESGCVDFVLPPKEIAEEILRIQHHPYLLQEELETEAADANPPHEVPDYFNVILDELRRASGTDFGQYRPNTIQRRALRRMVIVKLDTLADYANYMKDNPEEGEKLYDDILIPVTGFFRDFEVFEALKTIVYPAILKDKGNKNTIRMWAPGCSTGEETYSLAMTLLEFLGDKAASFQVQIFGTDLNGKGIQKARAGIYRETISDEISPERLQRFFVKVPTGYRVNKTVRDMCVFARQNLATDPPFSQMNLVVCRNLLIYIQPVLQKKIIPILHYALKPSGFLLMGSSESVSSYPDLFLTIDKKQKIYSKKTTAFRSPPAFGLTYSPAGKNAESAGGTIKPRVTLGSGFDVNAEADRLVLKNHAPAGVVINSSLEVIQYRGRTSPYLEPAPGKPSLNLLKLARNGIAIDLRTLINFAIKKNSAVRKDGVAFEEDGHKHRLNLSVTPFGGNGTGDKGFFLVLFENASQVDGLPSKTPAQKKLNDREKSSREFLKLKQEVADTKDALNSAIESEDAIKEEFQSANEEILSSNEELQSTNEELETSKEELQSANEELSTLNEELRNHNVDLGGLTNDLSNLLDAIRIPIVFVGADLRIRRFTPSATDIFRLLPSDVGRPITDIKHGFDVPDLSKLIEHTVASLATTEREVQDTNGRWRSLEIRPYRTADNRIEGAILTLPDIDRLKHTEQYLKQIIDNIPNPLLVLDSELKIVMANHNFCTTFHVSQADTAGQLLYRLGNEQWNIPRLRELLEEILPDRSFVRDFPVTHSFPDIGLRSMLVHGQRIVDTSGGGRPQILLSIEDVTERRNAELSQQRLSESYSRLAAIVESSDDAIISKNLDGNITSWNEAATRMFGHTKEEIVGQSILKLVPEQLHAEEREILRKLRDGERIEHFETRRLTKDGHEFEVSLSISPVRNSFNEIIGTSKIARDISGRKSMETLVIQADKMATMSRMAATIAHEVNNPLESVLNLIFLARTNNGSPEALDYLQTAEAEVGRVSHIARQTLGYYRDLGLPVRLTLNELVEEVLKVYQSKLQTRGVVVQRDFEDPRAILVNKGELVQVLSNILSNAIDAMALGGILSLGIRTDHVAEEEWSHLTIQDQGTGISAEHLSKVFEPFFTTKGNLGTGIGLWVAKQLLEKRGGRIELTSSTDVGRSGTRILISLPFSHFPMTVADAESFQAELQAPRRPS